MLRYISSALIVALLQTALAHAAVIDVGRGRVYKGNSQTGDTQIFVVHRINSTTMTVLTWDYTGANWIGNHVLNGSNRAKIWRSDSQAAGVLKETSSEIIYPYDPVQPNTPQYTRLWSAGVHAYLHGIAEDFYQYRITPTTLYHRWPGLSSWRQVGTFIGDTGSFGEFFSKQWCSSGQECTGGTGTGWPFEGIFIRKDPASCAPYCFDIDTVWIGISPVDDGFEAFQGFMRNGNFIYSVNATCSSWVNTLGLCKNGLIMYNACGNCVVKQLDATHYQWWVDSDGDRIVDCTEFNVPHGVGVRMSSRTSPTNNYYTYSNSSEGLCQ